MKRIILYLALCPALSASAQFFSLSGMMSPTKVEVIQNLEELDLDVSDEEVEGESVVEGDDLLAGMDASLADLQSQVSLPLDAVVVTSPFGLRSDPITGRPSMHRGVDLRANGDVVRAMMEGTVERTGYERLGGKFVVIAHGDYAVTYCHLRSVAVKRGDRVLAGDAVAISGNSGARTTGPHLHLKLTRKGKAVDPLVLLELIAAISGRCAF
jgi:murein DD-endopeptidase MepM/ murein hydrolase activator NlpD